MSSPEKDADGEETLFTKGSVVEVSSDQEGFEGAWYVATVIKPPTTETTTTLLGRKYLVQYHTLLADEDGSGPLRETVDVSFLRPVFPADDDQDHSFALHDAVDAFHRDGWWTGLIISVVGDSKYLVYFQNPPDQIEFTRSELRVRREWVGGKWVRPDCQEIIDLLSDSQEQLGHTLYDPKNAETPIQLESSFKSTKKKHKPATSDTSAMSSRPLKRSRKQNTEEAPLSLSPCEMTTPIQSLSKEALFGLTTPATGGTRSDCSKKSVVGDLLFAKTKSSQGKKFEIINPLSDNQEQLGHNLNDPKNAETPIQLKSSFKLTKKKHKPATPDTSAMSSRPLKRLRKQNPEEAPLSLTPRENMTTPIPSLSKEELSGLTTSATGGTRSDCSKKSVVGDSLFAKTKSSQGKKFATEQHKVHGLDSQRTKFIWRKGQKQSTQSEGTKASATGFESKGRSSLQSENPRGLSGEAYLKNDKETSAPKVGVGSDRKRRGRPPKLSTEEPKEGENSNQREKKGRPPKSLIEELMEDSEDRIRSKTPDVSEMDYSTKDVETVIDELPGNVFDDQPLLTWLGGTDSRTTVEDSRVFPGTIVNQCDEASARQDEIEIHSPGIASIIDQDVEASEKLDGTAMQCTTVPASGDVAVDKNHSLPFQKFSPIWESVESMEVFKIMPQKPHFSPLNDCEEDLREGLAIGKMVTFANIVQRTSKLRHTDPKSIIDRSLEILSDLKSHGFDIESVQTRLNELLLTKERQEQLEEELKEVERKIANHYLESNKVDEEIQEIAKMIKELQERLELAKAKKEMVDWGTLRLKSKLVLISENLRKAPFDFGKLAASLW